MPLYLIVLLWLYSCFGFLTIGMVWAKVKDMNFLVVITSGMVWPITVICALDELIKEK